MQSRQQPTNHIKKKILIAGDSFASVHLSGDAGWPVLLANEYAVTNVASPGIGEYKILSSLKSQNLDYFDFVIVSHTSPYRVHTEINPLYPENHIYRASDLIFADVEAKVEHDNIARSLFVYYQKIFDVGYYQFVHNKCCEEIDCLSHKTSSKFIHITHFEWDDLYRFDNMINFFNLWKCNRGPYTHYNLHGNQHILTFLKSRIDQ